LIHDLATDTFEGEKEEKISLIETLKRFPEWYHTYEQIKEASGDVTEPHEPFKIEILKAVEIFSHYGESASDNACFTRLLHP
jgi:hypothetical protein